MSTSSVQGTSAAVMAVDRVEPISIGKIVPWALLAAVVGALAYYFIGTEQGAVAMFGGDFIHEFVHDARHLLGFPCH